MCLGFDGDHRAGAGMGLRGGYPSVPGFGVLYCGGITNQMFTSIGIKYPTEHHRTHVLLLGWNNITETINHGGVEQDNKGVGLTWIYMD